ncbi:hypothetical protein SAY87_008386 [Trapa incisa]|uniref:Receptor-like serine/threonine-protein kinase n=1 Tax=Trapa incisa TaxID=236973 RepID=A0AAN7QGB7_9MYRT|nr:hypothetical protein SAY87_008386 [Trapa incisa]
MSAYLLSLIVLFLFIFINSSHAASPRSTLTRGSSISIEDGPEILVSPKKTFTCGFYGTGGNAYYFAIWFTASADRTVVWTGNRDKPVNGKGSKLTFQRNGALVLTDVDGAIAWESNAISTGADEAQLLESGNLVLKNLSGQILWESFDNPTDTLLPNQPLSKIKKLVSSMGRRTLNSGFFIFQFDNDNVLRLMYDGPDISSIYWPNPDAPYPSRNGRTTYNSSRVAILDDSGRLQSSDWFQFDASDSGLGVKRRLTIDYDGNLRLYSLNEYNGAWTVSWVAMGDMCKVHGVCGKNGICVYTPEPKCSCPPGYEVTDPSNWNKGCKPKFNITSSNFVYDKVKLVELLHTDYYGYDFLKNTTSFEWCRNACLADSNCLAFSYRVGGDRLCFGKNSLFNGYRTPGFPGTIYLKLPASLEVSSVAPKLVGSNPSCKLGGNMFKIGSSTMYGNIGRRGRWAYLYWFASVIGAVEILLFLIGWWILFRKDASSRPSDEGCQALASQFRKFRYGELKMATRNFREEIGRGGSGIVYKGYLGDGRQVAVKRLRDTYHGEEFFWAEVSTIGKINHMNLARMWGFCAEGRNKLLVYEFVENQSLDKHLLGQHHLRWKDIYKIALGVAKGLAYLHHECLEWVIHCDVKPENILLDSEFEPKIADFGLAKLLQREKAISKFSMIRGTKGYMAPEWALNLPITAKVDVFSYGVMVLEMVRGLRLSNWEVKGHEGDEEEVQEEAELTKFVKVIKRKILYDSEEDAWIDEFLDPRLKGQYNRRQARALMEVAIACVEDDRNRRPTMDTVVHVLLECEDEAKATIQQKDHTALQFFL